LRKVIHASHGQATESVAAPADKICAPEIAKKAESTALIRPLVFGAARASDPEPAPSTGLQRKLPLLARAGVPWQLWKQRLWIKYRESSEPRAWRLSHCLP
jgi:hypothetical protein